MQAVSARFLATIPQPHKVTTVITATPPGGTAMMLRFSTGTVNVDRTQRIRRTATGLTVRGGSVTYDLLSTPGCRIAIDHGFDWGGTDQELVPLLRGELSSAALPLGDGFIGIAVADLWQGLAGADYLAPFSPATTARRTAVVTTAVQEVYPGITIRNSATDSGTVGTAQVWTSRADMIFSLATDGGFDAYFAPDGAFVLTDTPTIAAAPAWVIKTGQGGTLKDLTRTRPLDKVYNAVVLEPATLDPAQAWSRVVAQITDTTNSRHLSRLGRLVPYRYQAPTLLTQDDAVRVAQQLLIKVQGSTETLALSALANPALEAGDVVRVGTPIDGGNDIVSHFLDTLAIDLISGAMSCGTRASQET